MPDLTSQLPPLREVIKAHGLRADKSLGQNFLLDGNITDKIISFLQKDITPQTSCIEIGPGPGGLTRSLLKTPALQVIAIEYDRRAVAALQDLGAAAGERLGILHGDALKTDIETVAPRPRIIAANLPYNIATPLLINWLKIIADDESAIDSMALMFQKEVAERIVATSGQKAYGRLSVMAQWLCDVRIVYDLPPNAFTPPPKVSSAVVYFKPKKKLDKGCSFAMLEKITAQAFNQRRKMIRVSLKDYLPLLEKLGIDPTLRAENLCVEDFIALAKNNKKGL